MVPRVTVVTLDVLSLVVDSVGRATHDQVVQLVHDVHVERQVPVLNVYHLFVLVSRPGGCRQLASDLPVVRELVSDFFDRCPAEYSFNGDSLC